VGRAYYGLVRGCQPRSAISGTYFAKI
jgi:hypothetical protein